MARINTYQRETEAEVTGQDFLLGTDATTQATRQFPVQALVDFIGTSSGNGNVLRSGAGAPTGDIGINGDFYIDTTNRDLYGPKVDGQWGSPFPLVGEAGPQGEQGMQGMQGIQGEQGPQGDTGAQGPQGEAGDPISGVIDLGTIDNERNIQFQVAGTPIGPVIRIPHGEDGATGPTGPIGPAGPEGPQGPVGNTGATGPRGLQGEQGPEGAQGPQGEQGERGEQGPRGNDGADGVDGADGARGPRGFRGATGNTGSTGERGEQGPQGEQGPAGETGPTGPQGIPGPQGPQGDPGADGQDGADGARGPQGEQGETGPAGADGATGDAASITSQTTNADGTVTLTFNDGTDVTLQRGPEGQQGPRGLQGEQGEQGEQGPAGDTGPRGLRGSTGPRGPRGLIGPQGLPGDDGQDGRDGAPGGEGPQGPRGLRGPSGAVGPAGPRGFASPYLLSIYEFEPGVPATPMNVDVPESGYFTPEQIMAVGGRWRLSIYEAFLAFQPAGTRLWVSQTVIFPDDSNTRTDWSTPVEVGFGGAGTGVSDFLSLTDTPNAYMGDGGDFVRVNEDADALEFVTLPVEANPVGVPTQQLTSIMVNGVIYSLSPITNPTLTGRLAASPNPIQIGATGFIITPTFAGENGAVNVTAVITGPDGFRRENVTSGAGIPITIDAATQGETFQYVLRVSADNVAQDTTASVTVRVAVPSISRVSLTGPPSIAAGSTSLTLSPSWTENNNPQNVSATITGPGITGSATVTSGTALPVTIPAAMAGADLDYTLTVTADGGISGTANHRVTVQAEAARAARMAFTLTDTSGGTRVVTPITSALAQSNSVPVTQDPTGTTSGATFTGSSDMPTSITYTYRGPVARGVTWLLFDTDVSPRTITLGGIQPIPTTSPIRVTVDGNEYNAYQSGNSGTGLTSIPLMYTITY